VVVIAKQLEVEKDFLGSDDVDLTLEEGGELRPNLSGVENRHIILRTFVM
jgi:hypothetical protein